MCIGNRAESSARFINAQLSAHYENAKRCSGKQDLSKKPPSSAVEFSTCLFEYHDRGRLGRSVSKRPAKNDAMFTAQFLTPELEFICNHDAILYLRPSKGSFVVGSDTKKGTSRSSSVTIDNFTVALRVSYCMPTVNRFKCEAIGSSEYGSDLIVLDFNPTSVSVLSDRSVLPGIVDQNGVKDESKFRALKGYVLGSYLPLLKKAGLHVYYSLPHYDVLNNASVYIDYSTIANYLEVEDRIHGISVDDINNYLRKLWDQADSMDGDDFSTSDHLTVSKHFLAKYRATHSVTEGYETVDVGIDMSFGPLTVKPLCQWEALVIVDLQEILFYDRADFSSEFDAQFSNWKLAFVVDIAYEEREENIKCISLKLAKGKRARFCELSSDFSVTASHEYEKLAAKYKSVIIDYMTKQYFTMLTSTGHSYVYYYDIREEITREEEETETEISTIEECYCETISTCGHSGVRWVINEGARVQNTIPPEFDIVTAVTQYSINAGFQSRWDEGIALMKKLGEKAIWEDAEVTSKTCVAEYSIMNQGTVYFRAKFCPPKVQLVCEDNSSRAIFFLTIEEGQLTTLDRGKASKTGSTQFSFKKWRIAFDVQLKLGPAMESLSVEAMSRLPAKKIPSSQQFIIDMTSMTLNLRRSSLPGLHDSDLDFRQIRSRREALVHYVTKYYLGEFERARLHVLFTIPLATSVDIASKFHWSPSSLKFQIIPFTFGEGNSKYIEGCFGPQRSIFERNMVVFMGVFGSRQLPSSGLSRGINWVGGLGRELPFGTVCLSRNSFLETHILRTLNMINKHTTIVPSFTGVEDGHWFVKLTTWAKHDKLKDRVCRWYESKKGVDRSLDFDWKTRDQWRYLHEREDMNGLYSIDCTTKNTVSVPTVRAERCTICVRGRVEMTISYSKLTTLADENHMQDKIWQTKMSISWAANVVLHSTPSGLQVELTPSVVKPHSTKDDIKFSETFLKSNQTTAVQVDVGDAAERTGNHVFEEFVREFPSEVDLRKLVEDLSRSLQGCWNALITESNELTVTKPFFNTKGDFILDLCVRTPEPRGRKGVNGGKSGAKGARLFSPMRPPTVPSTPISVSTPRALSPASDRSAFSGDERRTNGGGIVQKSGKKKAVMTHLMIDGTQGSLGRVSSVQSFRGEQSARSSSQSRVENSNRRTRTTHNTTAVNGATRTARAEFSPLRGGRMSSPAQAFSPEGEDESDAENVSGSRVSVEDATPVSPAHPTSDTEGDERDGEGEEEEYSGREGEEEEEEEYEQRFD